MVQNDVLDTAREEGRDEGFAEGRTAGLAEGRAEGKAEGRAEAIAEKTKLAKEMGLSAEVISKLFGNN